MEWSAPSHRALSRDARCVIGRFGNALTRRLLGLGSGGSCCPPEYVVAVSKPDSRYEDLVALEREHQKLSPRRRWIAERSMFIAAGIALGVLIGCSPMIATPTRPDRQDCLNALDEYDLAFSAALTGHLNEMNRRDTILRAKWASEVLFECFPARSD